MSTRAQTTKGNIAQICSDYLYQDPKVRSGEKNFNKIALEEKIKYSPCKGTYSRYKKSSLYLTFSIK